MYDDQLLSLRFLRLKLRGGPRNRVRGSRPAFVCTAKSSAGNTFSTRIVRLAKGVLARGDTGIAHSVISRAPRA